jgi:hypothetical protein
MQILESFVDSSSIFYICEVIGQMIFHQGIICENPFDSSFVPLRAVGDAYKFGNKIVSYGRSRN